MLTIGQLAAYAGVTTRAVRHYHAVGLLPEPARDHSGYRRYDAAAAVALIRVRTLADAGVPLSRVRSLLEADEQEFAAAVAEIDERLRDEIREREQHRARVAQLAAGDSLALPAEAVAYLAQLRRMGVPDRAVDMERDAWILVAAQLPEEMPALMALKLGQLDSPAVGGVYDELIGAAEWDADDRRVPDLADRLAHLIEESSHEWQEYESTAPPAISAELAALLDQVFLDAVPIAPRLLAELERRGWRGWTRLERIPRPSSDPDARR